MKLRLSTTKNAPGRSVLKKRQVAGVVVCVTLAVVATILWGPWARRVELTGRIYDAQTKAPISDAKIVVAVWNQGIFDINPRKYLLVPDNNGRFHFDRRFEFAISRIDVEAVSRDNKYDAMAIKSWWRLPLDGYQAGPSSRYSFANPGCNNVDLNLNDLNDNQRRHARYLYPTFSGKWAGDATKIVE